MRPCTINQSNNGEFFPTVMFFASGVMVQEYQDTPGVGDLHTCVYMRLFRSKGVRTCVQPSFELTRTLFPTIANVRPSEDMSGKDLPGLEATTKL